MPLSTGFGKPFLSLAVCCERLKLSTRVSLTIAAAFHASDVYTAATLSRRKATDLPALQDALATARFDQRAAIAALQTHITVHGCKA